MKMKLGIFAKSSLTVIFLASISLNFYFVMRQKPDSVVLRINNQEVLTESKMNEILAAKYKKSILQSLENSNIILLEAAKNHIAPPGKNEIEYIKSNFPNIVSEKSGNEQISEIYYVYKIYAIMNNVDKDIEDFYKETYETEPILYNLETVTDQDHQLLMNILSDFKQNLSLKDIKRKYNINISEIQKPTLVDLQQMDKESKGKYFHIMLDNKEMMLAHVRNTLKYNADNKESFYNFYFNSRYLEIRAKVLNIIKNKYNISYH
ncbi:hypothetical protein [Paenibacillus polymyxa]|uniref:hypothetical protein n=1 Tax=Paenibacillus polymyxa TaxID=1406 RepID=UPI0032AEA600